MDSSQSTLFRTVKPRNEIDGKPVGSSLLPQSLPPGKKGPVSAFQSPLFVSKLKQMELSSSDQEPIQPASSHNSLNLTNRPGQEKPLPQLPGSYSEQQSSEAVGFVEIDFTQQNPIINEYDDLYQNFRLVIMQMLEEEINYPLHPVPSYLLDL